MNPADSILKGMLVGTLVSCAYYFGQFLYELRAIHELLVIIADK